MHSSIGSASESVVVELCGSSSHKPQTFWETKVCATGCQLFVRETEMCLGIPGKVLEVFDTHGLKMAKVQYGGIVRDACLAYTPEADVGDYVIVHVGFAISKVDEEEAARTYRLLEEMGQLAELSTPEVEDGPAASSEEPGGRRGS